MPMTPAPRHLLRLAPLALGLAALLATAPARAQSLYQLYEAARAYDATVLAARAAAEAAGYRVAQAQSRTGPAASLVGNLDHTETDPPGANRFGLSRLGAAVAGRYPLYNKGILADVDRAAKATELSRNEIEAAEQDLAVRVSQAYFDVLAAQDALGTTQAGKKAITEQLASAKRNFEVGTATITDTREAQARFDLATAQELAAENDLRTKRIALDQLVGRTGVAPKTLALPVALPATLPADAEQWVNQADSLHPTIRRARLAQELAKLDTQKARTGTAPTVDAIARVSATAQNYRPSLVGNNGTVLAGTVGLELNMPLYTSGLIENQVKETVTLEEKARNDLEAARRGVAQATRVAYYGVQSGQAQVKALEAAESSSKLALEATQLGYRVGVRVNLDVLNAQSQLFSTQRDLARARYDVLLGGLRLRQASGQLKPEDLRAVDALLAK